MWHFLFLWFKRVQYFTIYMNYWYHISFLRSQLKVWTCWTEFFSGLDLNQLLFLLLRDFINDFATTIQLWCEINFAVIQFLVIVSQQNFANAMNAQLSCHERNCFCDQFVWIWMRTKWNFHRIWIVMETSFVNWVPAVKWLVPNCCFMWHIVTKTKWQIFCRRQFQMHFQQNLLVLGHLLIKKWVGLVKLLCIIMFEISKMRPKSLISLVNAKKIFMVSGFMKQNFLVVKISLMFVPQCLIGNISPCNDLVPNKWLANYLNWWL